MDNIKIKKIWQDGAIISINVIAISEFVTVQQDYYVDKRTITSAGIKIINFLEEKKKKLYVQFGEKAKKFTPAFSILIEKIDEIGHLNIEADMQIEDGGESKHNCKFNIKGEIGALHSLGRKISQFSQTKVGYECSLI